MLSAEGTLNSEKLQPFFLGPLFIFLTGRKFVPRGGPWTVATVLLLLRRVAVAQTA
jgi:hypothetical protein